MRAALAAVGGGLDIPPSRRVIVSVGSPTDAWNTAALWACVLEALPEAKQTQRERGLQAEGWLKAAINLGRSIPSAASRAVELIIR